MFLILKQGITLAVAGVAIGLLGGALLTRYLQNMLFGVSALDTATFVGASLLFFAVAVVAAYVPARQATLTDPLTALRFE